MRIGFAGAHRSGKTTLARALARIYDVPLLTSQAGSVAAAHGFDMANDNRLTTAGFDMQRAQLGEQVRQLQSEASFVSDRTPIDAAAYLLADATASAGNEETREEAVRYVEEAMRLTAQHFDIVILVPPAITFEAVDGKPPMNAAYQEHHHQLVRGMLFDDELTVHVGQIQRPNIDRYNRIDAALTFVDRFFPAARVKRAA